MAFQKYLDFSNNIESNKPLNDSLEIVKLLNLANKYFDEESMNHMKMFI